MRQSSTLVLERPPLKVATRKGRDAAAAAIPLPPSIAVQFMRYLVVGGLAFCVDYGALNVLVSLVSMHYLLAAALGFVAGMAINYVLSVAWVFNRRSVTDARVEFVLFLLVGVVGLGITEVILWGLYDYLNVPISKLIATGLVLVWNFSARKLLLFS